MTDLDSFGEMNEVYARSFPKDPPARACVEVSRLPKGVEIEIDLMALA
jgi:2-iminobutanoate/2-iminopropanoate deaminase